MAVIGMTHTSKGLLLDLADALASNTLLLSDIIESQRLTATNAKSLVQDTTISLWQVFKFK
jgi:hypothetical protein